jgi:hypothetical protein
MADLKFIFLIRLFLFLFLKKFKFKLYINFNGNDKLNNTLTKLIIQKVKKILLKVEVS